MKPSDLMIRCLALREGDQWVAVCLPFDLAVQAESLPEVREKLDEQIRSYLEDALVGQDRAHAEYLLTRRAPWRYWALYWVAGALNAFHDWRLRKFTTTLPMAPAHC